MPATILPYPPKFPALLKDYCEQMGETIRAKRHHDTRRHLFLNFLREAFGIDPVEIELEHKLTAGELHGRIDALYRHVIVEVKTDFDDEREDAQRELKKYFASRPRQTEYIGIVTDGSRCEAWHLNRNTDLVSISEIEIRADDPLTAWRWLDQFLSSGIRRIPSSDELVCRFGVQTAIFNKASDNLLSIYERVKDEPLVAVKFREWNALLAKVYGSPLGKPALFINHTYLTLISRIIVTLALKGVLAIPVSSKEVFHIPLATVARGGLDELIDFLSDFAHRGSKDDEAAEKATKAVNVRLAKLTADKEGFWWLQNFKLLMKLDKQRRNTIWAYILKNACRPEFLRQEKVDYIAGNPPWLSYRYIKDEGYKARVKSLTFEHGLLERGEVKLFTPMDTSTLFVAHCEREFLKAGGSLGMILPKTAILPAKQHLAFQRKGFNEAHDFTGVEPLFNVRTCMVIRRAPYGAANVPRFSYSGKMPRRNLSLADALPILTREDDTISFDGFTGEPSPYYGKFLNGATLWPRCLVFVEPVKGAQLNLKAPFLRTAEETYEESKMDWKLRVEGTVEREFLFGTVLAKDLIPFAVRKLSLVVLPVIETSHGDLKMIDSATALGEQFQHAHDWFARAETIWRKGRKDQNYEFADWLNYQNKLTAQSLSEPFIVLTNKSGTNLCAAMLSPDETKKIGRLPIKGFVAENVTYRYYAKSEQEAHYLVGILNTAFVNEAIKPFQSQGLLGERDIHRRPFEACPIPTFDSTDSVHLKIAELAANCREELLSIVPKMQTPVATARADARHIVQGKLNKLDDLVRKLLGNPVAKTGYPSPKSEPLKLMELF